MTENRILFVIYTPFLDYLPKRMTELKRMNTLNGVAQVITTPSTFESDLAGLAYDTIHLIKLYPDSSIDKELYNLYFVNEPKIEKFVDGIKTHNI